MGLDGWHRGYERPLRIRLPYIIIGRLVRPIPPILQHRHMVLMCQYGIIIQHGIAIWYGNNARHRKEYHRIVLHHIVFSLSCFPSPIYPFIYPSNPWMHASIHASIRESTHPHIHLHNHPPMLPLIHQ